MSYGVSSPYSTGKELCGTLCFRADSIELWHDEREVQCARLAEHWSSDRPLQVFAPTFCSLVESWSKDFP